MLFLGDPSTDRRVQSFQRIFKEAGWNVELLAMQPKRKQGPAKFVEYHRNLGRRTLEKRADVVLTCDLYSLSAGAQMRRAGRAKQLIYDAREVYTELPSVATKPLRRTIWKRLERRGLASTDLIIVTAPHDLQAILDVHGFVPRSALIRNLPWRTQALPKNRERLSAFNIPSHAKVIVYLGGLQQGRGLEVAINSLKYVDAHLLLIGEGMLRESLEQLTTSAGLESKVHFAGPMPSQQAFELLADCDVGLVLVEPVSRSYELALPSKLFEYMMVGLPVVASKMKHVLELFQGQPWIEFVNLDANAISAGVRNALQVSAESRISESKLALSQYHFEADAAPLLQRIEETLHRQLN